MSLVIVFIKQRVQGYQCMFSKRVCLSHFLSCPLSRHKVLLASVKRKWWPSTKLLSGTWFALSCNSSPDLPLKYHTLVKPSVWDHIWNRWSLQFRHGPDRPSCRGLYPPGRVRFANHRLVSLAIKLFFFFAVLVGVNQLNQSVQKKSQYAFIINR